MSDVNPLTPRVFFPQKTLFLDIFNPNMSHIRCNRSKKPFTACLSLVSLHKLFMTFSLGMHRNQKFEWPTCMSLGFWFFLLVFSFFFFSYNFAAVIDLLHLLYKFPGKDYWDLHGVAKRSRRKFCFEFFTRISEHFREYFRPHWPDHSDVDIIKKIFSSWRTLVYTVDNANFGQGWRHQKWNKDQHLSQPVTAGTGFNGLN